MLPSFPQLSSDCYEIQQWETAGAALLAALSNYANSCLRLNTNIKPDNPRNRALSAHIDSVLETHSRIVLHLKKSGASLANARNKLLSPLNRVPEDVLFQIFLYHVYDFKTRDKYPGPHAMYYNFMEQRLWQIYRRRHNLLSVCSFWRSIVSTRAVFWFIVPITNGLRAIGNEGLEISLGRAGGRRLQLSVTTSDPISDLTVDSLSKRIPQVDSLNIYTRSLSATRRVLLMFIQEGTSRLSRLSLSGKRSKNDGPLNRSDYIFPNDTDSESPSMNGLIKSLSTLSITGAYFHWDPARASNLVDLQIENLTFATPGELISLVRSISSAPQLRDLKMISVNCIASRRHIPAHRIRFSNLKFLTLGGLYLSVLQILFELLDHDADHFALGLTYYSVCYRGSSMHEDLAQEHDVEELLETLGQVNVDSLELDEEMQQYLHGRSNAVSDLLGSMPELQTLVLSRWIMTKPDWEALVCPNNLALNDDLAEARFPCLANLYMGSCIVIDEEGLRDVVKSHRLQVLELSGKRYDAPPDRLYEVQSTSPLSSEVVSWLRSEVLELRLVGDDYSRPILPSTYRDPW